mmetsp:Transcript_4965/g.14690  ORF Transcript_4965/g.14690 Transcript_4965/m.14690 type:complete len:234 (-) Transcript_4965:85-786(-)
MHLFGKLLLRLLVQPQLPLERLVLTDELVVLADQLLCLLGLPRELRGHLLVLGDGALCGGVELVVGHLEQVGLGLAQLEQHLFLETIFLLHVLALEVGDMRRVLLGLVLQGTLLLRQLRLEARLELDELRDLLQLLFVRGDLLLKLCCVLLGNIFRREHLLLVLANLQVVLLLQLEHALLKRDNLVRLLRELTVQVLENVFLVVLLLCELPLQLRVVGTHLETLALILLELLL